MALSKGVIISHFYNKEEISILYATLSNVRYFRGPKKQTTL